VELRASVGRGNANGKDASRTNTTVTTGNVLEIQFGGDTMRKGASGKAAQTGVALEMLCSQLPGYEIPVSHYGESVPRHGSENNENESG